MAKFFKLDLSGGRGNLHFWFPLPKVVSSPRRPSMRRRLPFRKSDLIMPQRGLKRFLIVLNMLPKSTSRRGGVRVRVGVQMEGERTSNPRRLRGEGYLEPEGLAVLSEE